MPALNAYLVPYYTNTIILFIQYKMQGYEYKEMNFIFFCYLTKNYLTYL